MVLQYFDASMSAILEIIDALWIIFDGLSKQMIKKFCCKYISNSHKKLEYSNTAGIGKITIYLSGFWPKASGFSLTTENCHYY